jgi:hypothetical protein
MSRKERRQQIRDVFAELGGAGLRRLVDVLLSRGVYTDEDQARFAISGMMSDSKDALTEKSVPGSLPGLRYAYPIESESDEIDSDEAAHGPKWQALLLCDYPQCCGILRSLSKGVTDDHAALVTLRDYCRERFGKAPEIVEILEPAS